MAPRLSTLAPEVNCFVWILCVCWPGIEAPTTTGSHLYDYFVKHEIQRTTPVPILPVAVAAAVAVAVAVALPVHDEFVPDDYLQNGRTSHHGCSKLIICIKLFDKKSSIFLYLFNAWLLLKSKSLLHL